MGQRVNATALRLNTSKKLNLISNSWFSDNNYKKLIHEDLIIKDYVENIFNANNFYPIDLNIKRNKNKLIINLFLCSLKLKPIEKNNLKELTKNNNSFTNFLNINNYDNNSYYYPIYFYSGYKHRYELLGDTYNFINHKLSSTYKNNRKISYKFSIKTNNKSLKLYKFYFNLSDYHYKLKSNNINYISLWLKQLFDFNSNNYNFNLNKKLFDYKFKKSRKTNSPYLNKSSSLLRLNIPFIFSQIKKIISSKFVNIKFNIINISDLKFDIKELNLLSKSNKKKFNRVKNIKENVQKLIFLKKKLRLNNKNTLKLYNLRKNILFNSNKQFKSISILNNINLINTKNNIKVNYISSYNLFLNYNLSKQYLNYKNYYIIKYNNLNLFKMNKYFEIISFYNLNYINLYNYINTKYFIKENPYRFLFSQKKFNLLPENPNRLITKLHLLKKDINFKFILFSLLFKSSKFLSEYIATSIRFKKFRDLQNFFNSLISNTSLLLSILKINRVNLKGIRIDCSGRFNGIDRTRTISIKQGILSFNQIDTNIIYSFSTSYTKYGSFGIKVWLSYYN